MKICSCRMLLIWRLIEAKSLTGTWRQLPSLRRSRCYFTCSRSFSTCLYVWRRRRNHQLVWARVRATAWISSMQSTQFMCWWCFSIQPSSSNLGVEVRNRLNSPEDTWKYIREELISLLERFSRYWRWWFHMGFSEIRWDLSVIKTSVTRQWWKLAWWSCS